MKKFITKVKNISFRQKMLLFLVLTSLIPILILGIYSYNKVKNLSTEKEYAAIGTALNQVTANMENKINSYNSALTYLYYDDNLNQSLATKHQSNYEMYISYRDTIDPLFITVRSMVPDIKKVTVYTDNPIYPHGNNVLKLDKISNSEEFALVQNSYKAVYTINQEKGTEFITVLMPQNKNNYQNVLQISLDLAESTKALRNIFPDTYALKVFDANGEIIYQYLNQENTSAAVENPGAASTSVKSVKPVNSVHSAKHSDANDSGTDSSAKDLNAQEIDAIVSDSISVERTLKPLNWKIVLYRPNNLVLENTRSVINWSIAVLGIAIIITIIVRFWVIFSSDHWKL